MKMTLLRLSPLVLVLFMGCASVAPPTEQMAVSAAALDNARNANGDELAAAEFSLARDKLERARLAFSAGDYVKARELAEQSQVDAQLAVARAQRMKSERSAEKLKQNSEILREEMQRKSN